MKKYNSFKEVIDILNNNDIEYLILRNYDNLLNKEMYMDGHGDVDMLVSDSKLVKDLLNAETYPIHGDDGTHYYIIVENKKVSVDLRHVGDGYYCTKWEQDMLERRVLNNGFYVMCPEDYFYSLIYHAVLQKPRFSDEYKRRLEQMASNIGVTIPGNQTAKDYICKLDTYMKTHGYKYTYPKDIFVPLHKKILDPQLIDSNLKLALAHWKFDTKCAMIEFAVKCKHLITTGHF